MSSKSRTIVLILVLILVSLAFSQNRRLQRGINYFNDGQYQRAVKELKEVIKRDPNNDQAYLYIGMAYRFLAADNSDQLYNALGGLYQAVEIKRDNPKYFYQLALVYDDMDKLGLSLSTAEKSPYELAVESYEESIRLKRDYLEPYLSLGLLYARKNRCELAIEQFNDVIDLDEKNITSYSGLVDCYIKQERFDEAIQNLSILERLEPSEIDHNIRKAKVFLILERYKEAKAEYQKILQKDPGNDIAQTKIDSISTLISMLNQINSLIKQADKSLKAGKFSDAIREAEDALKIDANSNEAKRILKEAKTKYADYWFRRGCEVINERGDNISQGELEQAVDMFNRALNFATDVTQMNKIINRWQKAQESIGKIARMFEVQRKGETFIIQGKYDQAVSYLDVFIGENPKADEKIKTKRDSVKLVAMDSVAYKLETTGRYSDALTFYKGILEKNKKFPNINFRLNKVQGDMYFYDKNWESSIYYYSKAKEIDSNLAKKKELPDSMSVCEKLAKAIESENAAKRKIIFNKIFIAMAYLFIGWIIGFPLGFLTAIKNNMNKERWSKLKLSIKNSITNWRNIKNSIFIIFIVVIFALFIFPTVKTEFLELPYLNRILILFISSIIILLIIAGFKPRSTNTEFCIYSKQVHFSPLINNGGKASITDKENIKLKKIIIQNIKTFTIEISKENIVDKQKSKGIHHGKYKFKPKSSLQTNLDIEIEAVNDCLTLKNMDLLSGYNYILQMEESKLIIRHNGSFHDMNIDKIDSCIKIEGSFTLKLKNECNMVKIDEKDEPFKVNDANKLKFKFGDKGVTTPMFIGIIDNSTRFEMYLIKNLADEIYLFKNISGRHFSIHDNTKFLNKEGRVSTLINNDSKYELSNELGSDIINKEKIIEMKPNKFYNFNLKIIGNNLNANFKSKLRVLKISEEQGLKTAPNKIPDYLTYIFGPRKWAKIITLIITLVGLIFTFFNYSK